MTVKFFVEFYNYFYYNICVTKNINNNRGRIQFGHNLPVSNLKNYTEVLKNYQMGEPVFTTRNGRGRFVVFAPKNYEREKAEKKLLMKLQEAEEAVRNEKDWLSLEELKALVFE